VSSPATSAATPTRRATSRCAAATPATPRRCASSSTPPRWTTTRSDIFFGTHDPTTPNRQGNDIGTQYRSAIFTTRPEQDAAARAKIEQLAYEGAFDEPIVTEVEPAGAFWPAEAYHANYFARNGSQPYCRLVVGPKVAKFRSAFAGRRKGN